MKFEIERRDHLSYEDFAENYLYANKPVIVTDAIGGWKALSRWTPENLKEQFGEQTITIDNDLKPASYSGAEDTVTCKFGEFIDRVVSSTDHNPAPYFRNQILYDVFPSLKGDIEPLPDYIFPNWMAERYLVGYVKRVMNRGSKIEIYIGGKGGGFPVLHYDGAAVHAFLMQIYGRKKFIVYPPEQEEYLYPNPEKENLSLINSIDDPDLEKFPLFAKAEATTFVLEPGELLFVPSGWWHTTKMLTASISISANVVNRSNWSALTDFVSMRRRNPAVSLASRLYLNCAGGWRSYRDRVWKGRPYRQ